MKMAKLLGTKLALVALVVTGASLEVKAQAQAAAVAPSSAAAAQAAAQTVGALTAAISSAAVQASAAGAAFRGFNSTAATNDLQESLARHPAFQTTVQGVVAALNRSAGSLSAEQGRALAAILNLAASLKNSVAFQVSAQQATPFNRSELDRALSDAKMELLKSAVSVEEQELESVAASFYSLVSGSELLSLVLEGKLSENSTGYRLIEAFSQERASNVDAAGLIAIQFNAIASVEDTKTTRGVLEVAQGLRSCANMQAQGR